MTDVETNTTCILGVSEQELRAAIRVLEIVAGLHPKLGSNVKSLKRPRDDDESNTNCSSNVQENEAMATYMNKSLRPLRKALSDAYEVHKLFQYRGLTPQEYKKQSEEERTMKRQKAAEREQQKRYIAATQLRRGRVEKLESLKESAMEEELSKLTQFMIPDGHVNTTDYVPRTNILRLTQEETHTIPSAYKVEEEETATSASVQDVGPTLPILRSCYCCKVRFRNLHSVIPFCLHSDATGSNGSPNLYLV
jgi:nitrogen regulatory protein PII-like uncharacterized protein